MTGVLALAALAAVPWTVSSRLGAVRLNMSATLMPARQVVREFADALALQVATRGDGAKPNPELAGRYNEAVATERARDATLAKMATRLGEDMAEQIARLRALTAQWHSERRGAEAEVTLTDVLTAAGRLEADLAKRQDRERARIRSLEAFDILLPSALVPLLAAILVAIYRTSRRMAALAREAEENRRALAAASEQKVTLLRGLTHDLKNTLGAAAGFATLLGDEIAGPLTTEQRRAVKRIGHLIEQTMHSVEDSLVIARTEAGTLPVRFRREDTRSLCREAATDFIAVAERSHLTIDVDCGEHLPAIDTDAALVSKIIGNLLSNAIKYTPAGGRIGVHTSLRSSQWKGEPGAWIAIEVRDSGSGIPAVLHEKVFDEFFRAPSVVDTTRGEGVGLAMSRRVARLLGGDITLESEEGRGATFTLWLPVAAKEAAHLRHPDPTPRLDVPAYDRRGAIQ